jgi:hypothetical protein
MPFKAAHKNPTKNGRAESRKHPDFTLFRRLKHTKQLLPMDE